MRVMIDIDFSIDSHARIAPCTFLISRLNEVQSEIRFIISVARRITSANDGVSVFEEPRIAELGEAAIAIYEYRQFGRVWYALDYVDESDP